MKCFSSKEWYNTNIKPHYSALLHKFKIICYNKGKEYFDEQSKIKGIERPHMPWFGNLDISRSWVTMAHSLLSVPYNFNT